MLTLVVTVVLGIGFALFATQNTGSIDLNFGSYKINDVPIYIVVLVTLLIALVISFFTYIGRHLSDSLTLSEQRDDLKELKKENIELTKKAHKLELENTKLKAKIGEEFDEDSIQQ